MKKHARMLLAIPFLLLAIATIASGFLILHPHPAGAASQLNLVANPNFANGVASWQKSSTNGHQIIKSSGAPLGDRTSYADFCGLSFIEIDPTNPSAGSIPFCNDQLWQNITLPDSFTTATLSYQLNTITPNSSEDNFHIELRTSTGTTIATVQTISHENTSTSWTQYTFDVTPQLNAYKGQNVQLYFQSTDNGSPIWAEFFVDNVSLIVS